MEPNGTPLTVLEVVVLVVLEVETNQLVLLVVHPVRMVQEGEVEVVVVTQQQVLEELRRRRLRLTIMLWTLMFF